MSLVCWLPLNESSATSIINRGTGNITLGQSNTTATTDGKFGYCRTFNNSDSYVSLSGSDLYNCFKGASTPFSVAMWIYSADVSDRAIYFGDYNLTGTIQFNIEKTAAGLARFYWAGSPDWSVSGATITDNAWTHLAFTYDGTDIKCYINGVLKGTKTQTLGAKNKTSGDFYLGRDGRTGATCFNGRMNDFRVYDHCLSLKEIRDLYKCLLVHLSFNFEDKITGSISTLTNAPSSLDSTTPDNSGLGGTVSLNNITTSTDTAMGLCSASFNGSTSYTEEKILLNNEDTTYTAWIKFGATGSYHIIDCRTTGGVGYQPFYGGTGYGLQFWSSNGQGINITAADCAFNTTDWFFIAGTMSNANGAKVYINGVLKGSSASVKPGTYGEVNMRVGTRCSGANWFNGKVADVKVYSRELTADEILDLYQTKADIDKSGNLYSDVYIESLGSDNILPTKTGIVRTETVQDGSSVMTISKGFENYTAYEYIQSSGAQYVDTGYIPKTNNITIELDMAWTGSNVSAFETFAGFMYSTTQNNPRLGLHKYSSQLMFGANSTTVSGVAPNGERFIYKGEFVSGAQKLYKNGTQIATNSTTFDFSSNTCPIYIFARYCPNSMNYANMKLYEAKIYEGTKIVRWFIPVISKTGGVTGLYDKVNDSFYTGAFSSSNVSTNEKSNLKNQVMANNLYEKMI